MKVWLVFSDTGGYDETLESVWGTEEGAQNYADQLRKSGLIVTVEYYSVRFESYRDREPQPSDGPDYHADHAAWVRRNDGSRGRFRKPGEPGPGEWGDASDAS